MDDRWLVVQCIMDALRPHCVPPPPPPPRSPPPPGTLVEYVPPPKASQVPVLFSTPEGRLEAIDIMAKLVWQAL